MPQDDTFESDDDSYDVNAIIGELSTPSAAWPAWQLGIAARQLGDLESAIRLCKHSLSLHPLPETYVTLAMIYDDCQREEDAVQSLCGFYVLVTSPNDIAMAEESLRSNGKSHLIKKAKAAAKATINSQKRIAQPGSRVSYWCVDFLSCRVHQSTLEHWRSLPNSPGIHALSFETQNSYCDDPAKVILFVVLDDATIVNVSYTITYITRMGQGNEVCVCELQGEDVTTAIDHLNKLVGK